MLIRRRRVGKRKRERGRGWGWGRSGEERRNNKRSWRMREGVKEITGTLIMGIFVMHRNEYNGLHIVFFSNIYLRLACARQDVNQFST